MTAVRKERAAGVTRVADRYAFLRERPPDERAGVFFVYRFGP